MSRTNTPETSSLLGPSTRRKPRGNLARLVSKFEVLDIKHGSDKKTRSSSGWGPSLASDNSAPSRLNDSHDTDEQAVGHSYDGANDMVIDICLSRASSCRWPSHMLYSNAEAGDDDDCRLKSQISPARVAICRQKSVAERRRAFEGKQRGGKGEDSYHDLRIKFTSAGLS